MKCKMAEKVGKNCVVQIERWILLSSNFVEHEDERSFNKNFQDLMIFDFLDEKL